VELKDAFDQIVTLMEKEERDIEEMMEREEENNSSHSGK